MSIIWVMRSMPSVATFSTCVSPRLNSADPWARGRTPTSADRGRISVALRPSSRTPCSTTRRRMTFFCRDFQAGPNSAARSANASSPNVAARWAFASSLTALNASSRAARSGTIAASSLPAKFAYSSSHRSSPYCGVGVHSISLTPCAAMNSSWNAMSLAISVFATSRPWATTSSVGASAPSASSDHVCTGASPSIISTSTPPSSLLDPATTMSNVASSVSW